MIPIKAMIGTSYTAPGVAINNETASSTAISPNDATATWTLNSSGIRTASGLSNSTWLLTGLNSDYEVRATLQSGSVSGTLNTWQVLSSNRGWSVTNTLNSPSTSTGVILVEIRKASTGAVQATANITIEAVVDI